MMDTKKVLKDHMGKELSPHKMLRLKKWRAGGKTNSDMLKYGRNMAKVMNQRSAGRGK
jgi:hypothetical protein